MVCKWCSSACRLTLGGRAIIIERLCAQTQPKKCLRGSAAGFRAICGKCLMRALCNLILVDLRVLCHKTSTGKMWKHAGGNSGAPPLKYPAAPQSRRRPRRPGWRGRLSKAVRGEDRDDRSEQYRLHGPSQRQAKYPQASSRGRAAQLARACMPAGLGPCAQQKH